MKEIEEYKEKIEIEKYCGSSLNTHSDGISDLL